MGVDGVDGVRKTGKFKICHYGCRQGTLLNEDKDEVRKKIFICDVLDCIRKDPSALTTSRGSLIG